MQICGDNKQFPEKAVPLNGPLKRNGKIQVQTLVRDAGKIASQHRVEASWPSVFATRYFPFHCLLATSAMRPTITAKRNTASPTSRSRLHERTEHSEWHAEMHLAVRASARSRFAVTGAAGGRPIRRCMRQCLHFERTAQLVCVKTIPTTAETASGTSTYMRLFMPECGTVGTPKK